MLEPEPYRPTGQGEHEELPPVEYLPDAHALAAALVPPGHELPAGQFVQTVALVEYWPASHTAPYAKSKRKQANKSREDKATWNRIRA